MWQQDTADTNVDGEITWEGDALTWCDALTYCENSTLAGHSDWRLPNVRELHSVVDYGRFDPAIDPVFAAQSMWYCSSTTLASNSDEAKVVGFGVGGISHGLKGP
jgi:hypothetical protein